MDSQRLSMALERADSGPMTPLGEPPRLSQIERTLNASATAESTLRTSDRQGSKDANGLRNAHNFLDPNGTKDLTTNLDKKRDSLTSRIHADAAKGPPTSIFGLESVGQQVMSQQPSSVQPVAGGEAPADEELIKPPYDVSMYYKGYNPDTLEVENPTAIVRLAMSGPFENMTFLIIGINAMWLGLSADLDTAPSIEFAHLNVQLVESVFAIYFTFELVVRWLAFRRSCDCFKDGWFSFDFCLVTLMVIESWVLPILLPSSNPGEGGLPIDASALRLLRLLRLARMVRLLRGLPDLLILVRSMGAAIRSTSTVMVLLGIILYVGAIIFKMQLSEMEWFKSIPFSICWLFFAATLGDNILQVFLEIYYTNWFMSLVYLVMVFLCMFTLLNMLIGILCGVVDQVSQASKMDILIDYTKETLLKELNEIAPGETSVTRAQFLALLDNQNVMNAFEQLDVDGDAMELIEGMIFDPDNPGEPDKEMSFADFLKRVLKMRNQETARVVDTIEVNKLIKKSSDAITEKLSELNGDAGSPKAGDGGIASGPIVKLIEDRFDKALSMVKMEKLRNDEVLSSIDSAVDVRVNKLAEKLEQWGRKTGNWKA
jgi:voltage-gated sodium channel